MIVNGCQRWRDGRLVRVPVRGIVEPSTLSVRAIDETGEAKPFVERHHYSGTFPAARLCVGLFRAAPAIRAQLVGVAVFSVPMNNRAVPLHTGIGEPNMGAELGRLVLLDDVPAYAETWFIARAFTALRIAKPGIQTVLSYADPMPRHDGAGRLVKPGHLGIIYQAMSAAYRGTTAPRTGYRTAAGEIVSGRALSKVRLEERGIDYAVAQLERLGAPSRERFEAGRDWISRLVDEGFLRRFSHPGNHTYVFPLTRRAKSAARKIATQPYPKVGI